MIHYITLIHYVLKRYWLNIMSEGKTERCLNYVLYMSIYALYNVLYEVSVVTL